MIAYLDHQIWCGMAENSTKYLSLKKAIEKAVRFRGLVLPYSSIHIQELAQIGFGSGLSKDERFEKALPKLDFIRRWSGKILLEINEDSSQVTALRRDPVEAYRTYTEVEMATVNIRAFLEMIPKEVVIQIQESCGVGSKRLNNMTEAEALSEINRGFKSWSESIQKDPGKWGALKENAKRQDREQTIRFYQLAIRANDEVMERMRKFLLQSEGSEREIQAVRNLMIDLAQKRDVLETRLQIDLQSGSQRIDAWDMAEVPPYTFEMLLKQVDEIPEGNHLALSFKKTMLLDFFGYKSKVKNRKSDFYDALHVEHAKVCDFFVTDDARLREKSCDSEGLIPQTNCKVLDSETFELYLRNLEPEGSEYEVLAHHDSSE